MSPSWPSHASAISTLAIVMVIVTSSLRYTPFGRNVSSQREYVNGRSELTTTSYAILGLLAVKPWTTYELAQQMKRALGQFWPRAESKLYEEPKKLVALGLATRVAGDGRQAAPHRLHHHARGPAGAGRRGSRRRAAGPVLEFEQLIKVFFAEHGSKDDLLATIESARAWTEERHGGHASRIPRGYLEGEGPFPERLPWIILVGQFLKEFTLDGRPVGGVGGGGRRGVARRHPRRRARLARPRGHGRRRRRVPPPGGRAAPVVGRGVRGMIAARTGGRRAGLTRP